MLPSLLRALPSPAIMKLRLRTFAMLDAIVAPTWRSFEAHPKWRRSESAVRFKDAEGNFFVAWFTPTGAAIVGFDHDGAMSPFRHDPPRAWPGLWEGLPPALAHAKAKGAFDDEDAITFACWTTGAAWRAGRVVPPAGKDADGSRRLLACFQPKFTRWATAYYDRRLDKRALDLLWWQRDPIDRATCVALNPDFDEKVVRAEAKLLAWPIDLTGEARAPVSVAWPKPRPPRSFGAAEFVLRCEPTRVSMIIHGKQTVASAQADVYEEIFDWVKARLKAAARQ